MTKRCTLAVAEWLLVATISMLAMAAVYPDMLVTHQVRFTAGHDSMIPYQSAWVHAGYFLRSGIQLWNRFDQVNHAYFHLATGFQGFAPIVEGWLFSLFAHGLSRPGEAFQAFHPIAFFTLATLFRTAGALALLRLYPVPFWARLLTLLVANTLLAAQTYNGVMAGFLYSLTPLVLFFVVRFFRQFNLATLLWLILALGLAFAQMPLIAVGYFYLPIHFFIVSAIVAFAWRKIRAPHDVVCFPTRHWLSLSLPEAGPLVIGYGALTVILAMNIDYLHILRTTFYLAGSGFGGTHGRFDEIFAPFTFLSGTFSGAALAPLPIKVLDFTKNDWWLSWQFIGAATLGLSLIGLTHGRHRERWLYPAAFILTVLAQVPRNRLFALPAHLITAFTDPFAFLIHSPQMETLLIPYLLIVPIGLGLTALWRRASKPMPLSDEKGADVVATAILLAGAVFALVALPHAAGIEAGAIFLGLALCLLAPRIGILQSHARLLAIVIPLAAVAADLWGYSIYLKRVPYTGDRILPRSFQGIEATDGRKINPVVIDYQNPVTLTFPRHVRVKAAPVTPSTDPGFFVINYAVYFIDQAYIGAYYNTVFLNREFKHPNLYELRHARYANASDKVIGKDRRGPDEKALYPLLRGDNRALFFAPVAVRADKVGPAALLKADAGRWAVSLEDPAGNRRPIPGARDILPGKPPDLPAPPPDIRRFHLTLADAVWHRQRHGFVEYDFRLPRGFPAYMATNLFTADRDAIRLVLDGKQLAPAQGYLIRPFTFDVRNVATNRLVIALPPDQPADTRFTLSALIDPFLKDVQPNSNDTTGLEVQAPADGWLVWRAPYENGWQATVNGRSTPIYIADRTAMAVRIPAGRSKVIFAYKPAASDCCTRQLVEAHLFASPILALLMLCVCLCGAAAGTGWLYRKKHP